MKYVADDGKKFDTEKECIEYEEKNLNCYWLINFNPDLAEGTRFCSHIEINTSNLTNSDYDAERYLKDWCYRHIGAPVAFVMGASLVVSASPIDNYEVIKSTREHNCYASNNTDETIFCSAKLVNNRLELTVISAMNITYDSNGKSVMDIIDNVRA